MKAPLPQRRHLPHEMPPWVEAGATFFVTVCCQPRRANQPCHRTTADTIFESVSFRQHRLDWHVSLLVLMPDHLHFLVSFPNDASLRKTILSWKALIARKTGVRWQRDFFDHRLRSDESFEEKAQYIRRNPVRAGLVSIAANWEFMWEPNIGGAGRPALPTF
ncbi:MAG: transposase [Opitutae bacterium]|nr:transposase [Opitutae bacterium]